MKNREIKGKRMLRPLLLVSAVGIACQSIVAQAAPTITSTPFANRPLHLQNDTIKSGVTRPKPNVMLFVDDSGSMIENVTGVTNWGQVWRCIYNPINLLKKNNQTIHQNGRCFNYTWGGLSWVRPRFETKMDSLINTLNDLLDDYQDTVNWNIQTLWGSEFRHLVGQTSSNPNDPRYKAYTIKPSSGTVGVNDGLIAFNDGTRFSLSNAPVPGQTFRNIWQLLSGRWYERGYQYPEIYMTSVDGNATPPVHPKMMTAAEMREFVNNLNPQGTTPVTHRYVMAAETLRNNIEYRCQENMIVVLSDGSGNNGMFAWPGGIYGPQPQWFPNHRHSGQIKTAGMAHFSGVLANTDLRKGGTDAEGGDWDDPQYPTQIIKTHTIGFGLTPGSYASNYLEYGAGAGKGAYALAQTPQDLKDAFDNALKSLAPKSSAGAIAANSAGAPATTSSLSVASLAATLSLNTGIWGSELRFIKLNPNTGKPTKDIVEPVYNGRRILVNSDGNKYWLDSVALSARSDFDINTEEEFKNGFIPWLTRDVNKSDAQIEADVAALSLRSRTVKKYRERAPGALDAARQMADVVDAPIRAFGKDVQGRQKFIVTAANDGMVYIFESAANASAPNKNEYVLKVNYLPAAMQRESADQSITVGKSIRATAEDGYGTDNIAQPHLYLNNGGISWAKTPSTGGFGQEYLVLGNMGQGGRGSYALTIGGEKRDNTSNTIIPAGLESSDPLNSLPLWETPKGSANQMGYTIGTGQIAQVATLWDNRSRPPKKDISQGVRIYAFIANGYKSNEQSIPYDSSPTLYVYEMMGQEFGTGISKKDKKSTSSGDPAGHLVTKVSVGNDPVTGAAAGALSSPTLLDNDYDGLADFAYAGDQYGNMYRFDLRDTPANWGGKVRKIYHGDPTQPITAAPGLHRISQDEYVVIFGTGSDIYDKDRTNTDEQIIMGIYDDLSVNVPTILTSSSNNILDQQLNTNNSARERRLSQNTFDKNLHKAWRVKLTIGKSSNNGKNIISSEKVVVRPEMLVGTAFLTSRIYKFEETAKSSLPSNVNVKKTCYSAESTKKTSGEGWLMAINAETGGEPDIKTTGFVRDFGPGVIGTKIDGIPSPVIFASRQDGSQRLSSGALDSGGLMPNLDHDGGNDQVNTKCVPVEFDLTLGLQSSDPNNPYLSFKGDAPRCEVEIIRANWREVPL